MKSFIPFIAQGVIGCGSTMIFIPVIPDMMESLEREYPNIDNVVIGDISSALFNSSFAFGAFVGPVSNKIFW